MELFFGSNTVTFKMFLKTFPPFLISFVSQSIVEAAVCGFGVYKLKGCLYISVFIFAQSDNIVNHRYEGRLLSFLAFFHQLILR